MCYFFSLMSQTSDSAANGLIGKVALVTGSAKRLGRAIALHLATEGADVIVHYHQSRDEAEEVVAEIKKLDRRAMSLRANLAKKIRH